MLELTVEFVLGFGYTLLGFYLLTGHQTIALGFISIGEKSRRYVVQLSLMGFMAGAFVVWAHPVYSWPSIIVTLVGYVGMLEATTYILYKSALPQLALWLASRGGHRLKKIGGLSIVLGVVILGLWGDKVF